MSLNEQTRSRIDGLVEPGRVTLFMKGTRDAPQCGFSATVVGILDRLIPEYATVNVLADPEIREGIKEYSNWPTIPQLYVGREFVGGCDIVQEMAGTGELHEMLGLPKPSEVGAPRVQVTPEAAQMIRDSMAGSDFQEIHVRIDARFTHSLGFGPREDGQIEAQAEGLTFLFDAESASRADGLTIGFADDASGRGLTVDNPNQPRVGQMSAPELKALMDSGQAFRLVDVRTPEENATARIEGAQLLDEALNRELAALPRDTRIVFHCHHGGRSQAAAEHFAAAGFGDVHNLVGGIDAWSTEVDPSVPRY